MREHPIPQDIVGYRFHIVGNMTIKQFAEVAVGVFFAFLSYQSNLIFPLKWLLIGMSLAVGTALAFLPIEERPLDHWLTTFIKVLYKPTKFFWQRQAKIPEPFLYKPLEETKTYQPEIDLSPARRQRIKEYLKSVDTLQVDPFDRQRHEAVNQILATFNQVTTTVQATKDIDYRPTLKVKARSLGQNRASVQANDAFENPLISSSISFETIETQTQDRQMIQTRTPLATGQVAQEITIPDTEAIKVAEQAELQAKAEAAQAAQTQDPSRAYVDQAVPASTAATQTTAQSATFNQDLPFPKKPTTPNVLVGMILTPNNELVNDAIVEIKNQNNSTVRAIKTNALGQFFVSTPLPDGTYTIETERAGLSFSPYQFQLSGEVVEPIEIRSIV